MKQLRVLKCRGKEGACPNKDVIDEDLCEECLPVECLNAFNQAAKAFQDLSLRFPEENLGALGEKLGTIGTDIETVRLEGVLKRCHVFEREVMLWESQHLIARAAELDHQFGAADIRAHNLTQAARRYQHQNNLKDAIRTARDAIIQFEIRERMKKRLDEARAAQKEGSNEASA